MTETETGFEKYVVLRFTDRTQLKSFYKKIEEARAELVRSTEDGDDLSPETSRDTSGTLWSDFGAKKYDDKRSEKAGLPHPKSKKGVPGSD